MRLAGVRRSGLQVMASDSNENAANASDAGESDHRRYRGLCHHKYGSNPSILPTSSDASSLQASPSSRITGSLGVMGIMQGMKVLVMLMQQCSFWDQKHLLLMPMMA